MACPQGHSAAAAAAAATATATAADPHHTPHHSIQKSQKGKKFHPSTSTSKYIALTTLLPPR
jgi:hypothetical protein